MRKLKADTIVIVALTKQGMRHWEKYHEGNPAKIKQARVGHLATGSLQSTAPTLIVPFGELLSVFRLELFNGMFWYNQIKTQ